LAEATLMVTGGKRATPIVLHADRHALEKRSVIAVAPEAPEARSLIGCGGALLAHRVIIVDPETRARCEDGQIGEVWIQGPSVAAGYWGREAQTRDVFRARVAGEEDARAPDAEYLRSGDLGFLRHGELFVTGRAKDLIVVSGRNHYPQDLERSAEESHASVRPGCCVAFPIDVDGREQPVIVAEIDPRRETGSAVADAGRTIRSAIWQEHDLAVYDVALVGPGVIPKTSSGKLQRFACKAAYMESTLDVTWSLRNQGSERA
jgi:acyl-CoA synthetase (AMP-forming)/AMP-acid ligase II